MPATTEDASVTDEPDTAQPKAPSPLDVALMTTRHRHPDTTSLWLDGDAVVTVPPLALMLGNVTAVPQYAEEHATSVEPAVQALTALHGAVEAVLQVRAAARSDPTQTQASAILTVASAYDKLVPVATRKLDAALQNVQAQIKAAEQSLAAPVTQGATGPFAAELRQVVRGLEPGARMAALTAAIRDGDAGLIGAVLGAPAMLSGLDPKAAQAFTAQWQQARNPAAVAKLALLNHTAEALVNAGRQLYANIEGIHGARYSTIERLRTATGKAQKVIGAVLPAAA